jgi:hypothetical protein
MEGAFRGWVIACLLLILSEWRAFSIGITVLEQASSAIVNPFEICHLHPVGKGALLHGNVPDQRGSTEKHQQ